jgi:hypothetical protein
VVTDKPADEKPGWLDRKENVTKIVRALYVVCGLVILADLVARTHPETNIDSIKFFYGVFGFVASVVLVLIAKQMRKVLNRPEDYYDD